MYKLCRMEHIQNRLGLALVGVITGMVKYVHMIMIGDTITLNMVVLPVITSMLCAIAAMFSKDLYKWIKAAVLLNIVPWFKNKFTKK